MAQENPRADVQPLYEEALRAMGAKDYQTACQKFSEVTQKYPEGIGAWLELGRCEQARGRIARAYEVFLAAEVAAKNQGQTERSLRAANAAKALEPRLSFWTISVPAEIRKLPGLVVHVDGSTFALTKWDKPLPIDGGKYLITAEATGKRTWETTISLKAEGDSQTVVVGPLLNAEKPTVVFVPEQKMPPVKTAGFVAVGVGAAGLVAGVISGSIALSRHNEAVDGTSAHCVNNQCDRAGADLEQQSRTAGNVSTGMFIAGFVLAAGGVTAILIQTGKETKTKVSIGPMGLSVSGAF